MDLSFLKKKMADLSKPAKQKKEKIDYKAIYWRPKLGKNQIRIVPSAFDKKSPFKEAFLHYGYAKFPIFALTNWGEADPIVDFIKELRKSKDKDDWKLASKLEPKMRVFIPVVARGEEHLGTRLWEVGVTIYKQLLAIADDEDYGDYTDVYEGRDFTVTATEGEVAGKKATTCTIQIKPKVSVLSDDKELVEKLITQQPNILEVHERYKHTYESLKEVLQKYLNPSDETEVAPEATATVALDDSEDEELGIGDGILPTEVENSKKGKVKNADKFDELFKS